MFPNLAAAEGLRCYIEPIETTWLKGTTAAPNCKLTIWFTCSAPVTVPTDWNGNVLPAAVTETL